MSETRDPPSPRRGALRRWWSRSGGAPEAAGGTWLPAPGNAGPVALPAPGHDPAAATAALQRLFAPAKAPPALLWAFAEGMATLHGELADVGVRLRNAYATD